MTASFSRRIIYGLLQSVLEWPGADIAGARILRGPGYTGNWIIRGNLAVRPRHSGETNECFGRSTNAGTVLV